MFRDNKHIGIADSWEEYCVRNTRYSFFLIFFSKMDERIENAYGKYWKYGSGNASSSGKDREWKKKE